jgi:hypothetical protein
MDIPKPPRPFDVGDRVRTTASTEKGAAYGAGVVLEFRDRGFDVLVAVDGWDPAGYWRRSSEFEIEDPDGVTDGR